MSQSEANIPQRSSESRDAWRALIGCSILQLPIWGIAMTFGIFQEAYTHQDLLHGDSSAAGVIGQTMNGVMYLSMPILFTLLDRGKYANYRRTVAIAGTILSAAAFFVSSFSKSLWHLILLQGVLAALGNAMVYSPTTLYLDQHFKTKRATAYGATYSSKNIVGTVCPIIFSRLLSTVGFRWTIRIWAAAILVSGAIGISILPKTLPASRRSSQKVPWSFLKHRTFYVYSIANAVFSCGYGLPQTYLSSYATDILRLTGLSSALMITLFNAPGIISCIGFGLMSDKAGLSSAANTSISAGGSCLCALLLWGLASNRIPAVLYLFAIFFGFFSGGYSSCWGGWLKDFEREAAEANEAVNTGTLVGLFNGARGVGYVVGGVAGVELLNLGAIQHSPRWGYGTNYGSIILFTGLCAAVGGWSVFWNGYAKVRRSHWWRSLEVELGARSQG